jgi:hypothetical protein
MGPAKLASLIGGRGVQIISFLNECIRDFG